MRAAFYESCFQESSSKKYDGSLTWNWLKLIEKMSTITLIEHTEKSKCFIKNTQKTLFCDRL